MEVPFRHHEAAYSSPDERAGSERPEIHALADLYRLLAQIGVYVGIRVVHALAGVHECFQLVSRHVGGCNAIVAKVLQDALKPKTHVRLPSVNLRNLRRLIRRGEQPPSRDKPG
jgi:hypothetical protein